MLVTKSTMVWNSAMSVSCPNSACTLFHIHVSSTSREGARISAFRLTSVAACRGLARTLSLTSKILQLFPDLWEAWNIAPNSPSSSLVRWRYFSLGSSFITECAIYKPKSGVLHLKLVGTIYTQARESVLYWCVLDFSKGKKNVSICELSCWPLNIERLER